MMIVKLIKIHESWPDGLKGGELFVFKKNIKKIPVTSDTTGELVGYRTEDWSVVINKKGEEFLADEMAKNFSLSKGYSNIFEKCPIKENLSNLSINQRLVWLGIKTHRFNMDKQRWEQRAEWEYNGVTVPRPVSPEATARVLMKHFDLDFNDYKNYK